jgi:hypothetical protein
MPVLGPGIDDKVGAEFLSQLQLLVGDIDGRDRAAEDLRVLQRHVPETADAGDRHQVARPDVADLDGLEGGDAGAGQRCGFEGVRAWPKSR